MWLYPIHLAQARLNLNFRDDVQAAHKLNTILKQLVNVEKLSRLLAKLRLKARHCLLLCPGPTITKIERSLSLDHFDTIVIVDSAVNYLTRHLELLAKLRLVKHRVIVTDLDASLDALIQACTVLSPILVVHAHGDNIQRLDYVKLLAERVDKIIGTCQVPELSLGLVEYCPGFTDGDRALYIASQICYTVTLAGWDLKSSTSLGKPMTKIKVEKLKVAELISRLIELSSDTSICGL